MSEPIVFFFGSGFGNPAYKQVVPADARGRQTKLLKPGMQVVFSDGEYKTITSVTIHKGRVSVSVAGGLYGWSFKATDSLFVQFADNVPVVGDDSRS